MTKIAVAIVTFACLLGAALGAGQMPAAGPTQPAQPPGPAPQAASGPRLTFDVVSVKPASPDEQGGIVRPDPGYQTYICQNVDLLTIMTVAYQVTGRQLSGGPSWLGSDRWDITAKADKPHNIDELHLMLQHALEDRFGLRLHRETRQESVYDLTVDKGGPKLTPHPIPNDTDSPPISIAPDSKGSGNAVMSGTNVEMNYFAFFLSRVMQRGVVNKTGLTGHFDITLTFPPPVAPSNGAGGEVRSGPPDFTPLMDALPGQLGLRLQPGAKGPVQYIVIDHAEKPIAN